jgi:hypothetical protein
MARWINVRKSFIGEERLECRGADAAHWDSMIQVMSQPPKMNLKEIEANKWGR